jgi:hypothetical protein
MKSILDIQTPLSAISCRDHNRIALHSHLLTCAAVGLLNLVLVDGTHPIQTPFPDAKPVYDLDALGLLCLIRGKGLNSNVESRSLLSSFSWRIGVHVGGNTSADLARANAFLAIGIDLLFVSSVESISSLRKLTDKPIFLSVGEEERTELEEIMRQAESAGAQGVNVIARAGSMESV